MNVRFSFFFFFLVLVFDIISLSSLFTYIFSFVGLALNGYAFNGRFLSWNGIFFYRREEKGMNCFKRITYVGLFIYDFHALNSFINYWKLTSEIYLHRKK